MLGYDSCFSLGQRYGKYRFKYMQYADENSERVIFPEA